MSLEARKGRDAQVKALLLSALPSVVQEVGTTNWYAFQISSSEFGVFDIFPDEQGRNAHLTDETEKVLFTKAEELLAAPPHVERVEILAAKTSAA